MSQEKLIPPPAWSSESSLNPDRYQSMIDKSTKDFEGFWSAEAEAKIKWQKPWHTVRSGSFEKGDLKWFEGAELNVSENCLDRHIDSRGDKTAIIAVGNEPGEKRVITYRELHQMVNRFAAGLRQMGVAKGDRVILYMPMVPEAAVAMLACARLGAIHSVVFGGFSARSLRDRIDDCQSRWVITADEAPRGKGRVPLKKTVDDALAEPGHAVEKVVVLARTGEGSPLKEGRDILWADVEKGHQNASVSPVAMDAEDPLFILYTSGSTGKPKGLMHTTGGYLLFATCSYQWVFDHREDDVFWCTADVGWITGHSYIVYGPLSSGATVVMFEGTPTYPDASRFWQEVEELKVSIFYTAPTAIRALMKLGDDYVNKHDLSSIRVLGTVGEPINPKAWHWYHQVIGRGQAPIVDTWWQTETGGILISPLPGVTALKPGCATKPLFGIQPNLLDPESAEVRQGETSGALVLSQPWPGIARSIWGDHQRYLDVYMRPYPGHYFTGDGASRDEHGYYSISGRMDDVINVSGHRLGTFEIESALVGHEAVAESAVIGIPHDIKGQALYAFVTLKDGQEYQAGLKEDLVKHVRKQIGPIATPERIHWAPALPKTRSGKIMRRILRKIATGESDSLGDTTTLADPGVINQLMEDRAR